MFTAKDCGIYENGVLIGMLNDPELAKEVVEYLNQRMSETKSDWTIEEILEREG